MLLIKPYGSEIKVALVGFRWGRKTTLFTLIKVNDIPLDYLPTMYVSYKRMDGKIAETDVILWDFAGQERFTPLWPMLLRGTHVILLVTDFHGRELARKLAESL